MLKSALTRHLERMRDNDVMTGNGNITDVYYDSTADVIHISSEDDHLLTRITDDLIVLLTELDRGLTRYDIGNSVWYLGWRKRVSDALGLLDGELNSRES